MHLHWYQYCFCCWNCWTMFDCFLLVVFVVFEGCVVELEILVYVVESILEYPLNSFQRISKPFLTLSVYQMPLEDQLVLF